MYDGGVLNLFHMKKETRFPAGTARRMQQLIRQSKTSGELKRIQSVMMGALGMPAGEISQFVGYNEHYIRHFWSRFRAKGEASLEISKGAGNRNRALLSAKMEEVFLAPFFNQAKRGGILIVQEVHKAYEKQFKRLVHHSVIYNLLHRHGWRKIVPRPAHPKGDTTKKELFKASFPPQRLARQS